VLTFRWFFDLNSKETTLKDNSDIAQTKIILIIDS